MNTRRLILYLILNAVVSASATLAVLWFWDRTHPAGPAAPPATRVAQVTTAQASPAIAPATDTAPPPAPTPVTHVVQSGDTLGSIAQQYDVALEDLLAANGLSDPNVLDVGQVLVIPIGGFAPPSPTPGPLPTNAAETPLPTATRDPNLPLPRLAIREVRAAGVLAEEMLIIVNTGGPVDLAGWTLRDEAGNQYTFPALTLFEAGAVNVHTAAGEDSVIDLHWGLAAAVWASGRTALLSDASGNLHARYTLP